MEVTCCVDVLTDAADHYDADAYGEYMEDDYSADSDEPGEYCACDKCMDKRMQDPEFYLGYDGY